MTATILEPAVLPYIRMYHPGLDRWEYVTVTQYRNVYWQLGWTSPTDDPNFDGDADEPVVSSTPFEYTSALERAVRGGALSTFWTAVRNRKANASPVDVLVVSDSTAALTSANTVSTHQRWHELHIRRLADEFGGGYGIYYQARTGDVAGYPIVCTGTANNVLVGLGLQAATINSDADTVVVTTEADCDRVLVHYRRASGGGTLTISVDGGFAEQVPTAGANGSLQWDSGALTPGVHTVTIGRVAGSGDCIVEGAMLEYGVRGETPGFRLWDCSHNGYGAIEFAAVTTWVSVVDLVDPDYVIVAQGINDIPDGAAAFRVALDAVIDAIEAVCSPSFTLMTQWGQGLAVTDTIAPLNVEVRDVADDNGYALADLHEHLGWFGATWRGLAYDNALDQVHPLPAGAELIERYAAIALGLDTEPRTLTQQYVTAGTYDIVVPPNAVECDIELVGAGGGGGSGRRGAAGLVRCGGGGGASGAYLRATLPAHLLAGLKVTVGTGGPGGAAVASDTTNGAAGTAGSGTYLGATSSVADAILSANAGTAGGGGTAAAGTAGARGEGMQPGGGGGAASGTGLVGVAGVAGNFTAGGGSGGGITSADAVSNGGAGGVPVLDISHAFSPGAAGTSPGGAGGAGVATVLASTAGGGGGGASSKTGAGGAGGAGATPGGGGGGGGASLNGAASGAGGRGGDGRARLIWRLR